MPAFVYASSLLVYGSSPGPIGPDTPTGPRLDYGRAKVEAEVRLASIARRVIMKLAVLRLPHVYGARDLMFEQIRRRHLFLPRRGRDLHAHMHVSDAARVMIAAADQGWTGTSPVADALAVTWRGFMGVIRDHHARFRSYWIPPCMALGATAAASAALSWRRQLTIMTPDSVIGFNLNLSVKPGLVCRWRHPVFDRKGW